jgi:broad specificity phosphatase PhoE
MFIFVRHGEAEHNVATRFEGDAAYSNPRYKDAHLTFYGTQQCRGTGQYLKYQVDTIDSCYTSPLTRCIETASYIRELLPFNRFVATDALIECQGGGHICNTPLSKDALTTRYHWIDCSSLQDSYDHTQPRETFPEVRKRVVQWLTNILEAHPTGNVLLSTHHDVLLALLGKKTRNAETIVLSREELIHLVNA